MMEVNNSLVTFVFRDKLLSLLQSKRGSIVKLHLVCWRIFHLIERKMIFSVLDSSFPTWDMILSRRRDNLIFSCRTVSHHGEVWSKQCPLKLFLGHLEMIQGICCLCSRSKLSFPWGLRRVSCFSLRSLDSLSTRSFFCNESSDQSLYIWQADGLWKIIWLSLISYTPGNGLNCASLQYESLIYFKWQFCRLKC